jgi:hypothetical protein
VRAAGRRCAGLDGTDLEVRNFDGSSALVNGPRLKTSESLVSLGEPNEDGLALLLKIGQRRILA